jgi:hypothetical protein
MVEPDTGGHRTLWLDLAKKIITAIREVDPVTPILVEPADWGGVDSLTELDPLYLDPKGDLHIVYAAHQYVPTTYTQQTEGKWEYSCGRPRFQGAGGREKITLLIRAKGGNLSVADGAELIIT